VQCIVLDEVRQGKKVPLFGSKGEAGDLAVYNPIAREDLGRFLVSCVLNKDTYGRTLAVGGPWSADNVTSLKENTELMIQLATPEGKRPSKIKPLGMNLSEAIYLFMEAVGHVSKQLKKVATIVFYYTKYWSTVSHFSPGTGVYPVDEYTRELVAAMKKDPEAFAKFIKDVKGDGSTSSVVYPTPRNSWWDISQPSLSSDQIPMGAGKPQTPSPVDDTGRADDAHSAGLAHLRTMAAIGGIRLSDFHDCAEEESDLDAEHMEEDSDWVGVESIAQK
jgi:hypothetical protein